MLDGAAMLANSYSVSHLHVKSYIKVFILVFAQGLSRITIKNM